jgi:hypothetical protein
MPIDRKTVALVAACLAVGWWLGSSPSSPVNPNPQRPVLRALARLTRSAARLGLWMAVSGSRPEELDDAQIVHQVYDERGNRVVNHGEGW